MSIPILAACPKDLWSVRRSDLFHIVSVDIMFKLVMLRCFIVSAFAFSSDSNETYQERYQNIGFDGGGGVK
eukprot:3514756-Amphidinium_carterae.1